MSLIPQDELTILKAASAVKTVASTAVFEQEQKDIAYAINTAANTGNTEVLVHRILSKQMETTLTQQGYTLTHSDLVANPNALVTISWDISSNG